MRDDKQPEHLEGTVEDVIFYNEDSGFTVLAVSVEDELITLVGKTSGVAEGEEITAEGHYDVHPRFGHQFKADVILRTLPTTSNAILKYLSSGAIKGIGPAIARRLVDRFRDSTLEVMEKQPERLAEVRGISADKARAIGEEFARLFGIRTLMIFLTGCGLSPAVAIRVWKRWGGPAMELIREDPYILCCDETGLDFDTTDEIGRAHV